MKTPAEPVTWNRLVVLYNPASTDAKPAKKRIAQLETTYPGQVLVLHTKKDLQKNKRQLKTTLQKGDILVVAGGDGTVNQTIRSLGRHNDIPLLPLGTGNANDLASSLYGSHVAQPLYILKHAKIIDVYPLECTIMPDQGKPQTHLAACYVSFGSTALGAAYVNQSSVRERYPRQLPGGKYLGDLDTVAHTIYQAKPFEIDFKGKKQSVLDIIITNGPRMARTLRFPSRLEERDMFIAIIRDKNPLHVVQGAVDLFRGTFPGEHIKGQSVSFAIHSPTAGQTDGEPFTVEAPCVVSIKHAAEPVHVLSVDPTV